MTAARQSISLDGIWDFVHHGDGKLRQASVPAPWQALFDDLRQTSGRATYRRTLARPVGHEGQRWWLCFGAVNWSAIVRLNGNEIVRSENGWLPFEAEIADALWQESNLLEVECLLPDGNPDTSPDAPFAEIPHGKQSWYGPTGGIWQSVRLELRADIHLDTCAITADMAGNLTLRFAVRGEGETAVGVQIHSPDGALVSELGGRASSGKLTLTTVVENPKLWSPESPTLYSARVAVGTSDVTQHSFGFRSISTENGAILLNGQPFYMRGALDQDYWPVGICTPPSTEAIEDQFRKAKELGLNTLRCHIKVPDPRYHDLADRLGLLVWTEFPNVATLTEASARRMRETMTGILKRDGNHPSIGIWTIINEDWGTRLGGDPAHRAWLKAEFDWLKAADPTRLVVDNSPCHGNFHVKTDINDFHWYRSVPERRDEWDALTAEFAAGADWTFTPFGDGIRQGDEPLIVSEFGVWGLPDPAEVQIDGAEPWWMETGGTWGEGAAYPHGIEHRFATLGLGTVFGSFEAFIKSVQLYQFQNLKYQIESMRSHAPITGYVITEMTDVHWESNGLLDMNRNPRVFHDQFAAINTDLVVLARPDRFSAISGQELHIAVSVASGGRTFGGGVLTCALDGKSVAQCEIGPLGVMAVSKDEHLNVLIPAGANRMVKLDFHLSEQGKVVAGSHQDIAVYAPRAKAGLPTLNIKAPELAAWFGGLGYKVSDQASLCVVHALGADDIAAMQGGARYLVLADGSVKTKGNLRLEARGREQPFIPIVDEQPGLPIGAESPLPNINLIERHGTMWRGDWIAGFSWIRRDGAFADLPGGPLLDASFDKVVPRHVMTGFRPWEFAGSVQAGLVVGWVQKPAALIARRIVGQGLCLATTFRLTTEPAGADPVAAALADALVRAALDD
jgi:hypothetical protein